MTRLRTGVRNRSALGRVVLALALTASSFGGSALAAPAETFALTASGTAGTSLDQDALLPAWDGSINLYRTGVFTTQKTWYYCTAADVQIIRNIVRHREDHTRASQDRYFSYMRQHMRYAIPLRQGVDPAGWTAGMRHYVDDRYRLVRSATFTSLIRSAVKSLRRTNLPVALFVDHGNHGWVLHGFSATADPAVTNDFRVTSVRVTGPLWGRQSRTYGYDMRPNKKLTRSQLKDFVTPWHYAPIRMVYEGEFLSIQPVGTVTTPTAPVGSGTAVTTPTPTPSPSPTLAPPTVAATAPAAMPAPPTTEATAPAAMPTAEAISSTGVSPPSPTATTGAAMAAVMGTGPPDGPERTGASTALAILAVGATLAIVTLVRRRGSSSGA